MNKHIITRRTALVGLGAGAAILLTPKKALAAYTGIGDIVAARVYAGLRAYNAAYAASLGPCMDVVSSTGGAVTPSTINVTAAGAVDLSMINAAIATASGNLPLHCTKLYDQVGTNHFTQGTLANQPTVQLTPPGSGPAMGANQVCLQFNGTSQGLVGTSNLPNRVPPYSYLYYAIRTGGATTLQVVMFTKDAAGQAVYSGPSNTGGNFISGTATLQLNAAAADNGWRAAAAAYVTGANASSLTIDNGTATTGTQSPANIGAPSPALLRIGLTDTPDAWLNGAFAEAAYFEADITSNVGSLYTNQNAYWTAALPTGAGAGGKNIMMTGQ